MATTSRDTPVEEMVPCTFCGDSVPRSHTVVRAEVGRICWFCHEDECVDPEADWDDDSDDDDFDYGSYELDDEYWY